MKQIKGNKSNYDYKRPKMKIRRKTEKNDDRENREEEKEKYERFVLHFFPKKKTDDFWYAMP